MMIHRLDGRCRHRGACVILFLFVLFAPCLAEDRPWLGGLAWSNEGFADWLPGAQAEWMGLRVFIDPFQASFLNPSLHTGVLFPLFPLEPASGFLQVGLQLSLAGGQARHAQLFGQFVRYEPAVQGFALYAFGSVRPELYRLSPAWLRFRSGDGAYAFLLPAFYFDEVLRYRGWGLALFDFSYFLVRRPGRQP